MPREQLPIETMFEIDLNGTLDVNAEDEVPRGPRRLGTMQNK